jgi:hypothetical protein
MPAQISEIGYGGELISSDPNDLGYMQESPTEYAPGSALAYGGDDGENSVDLPNMQTTPKDPVPVSELNTTDFNGGYQPSPWDVKSPKIGPAPVDTSQPCGLTIAEWEAHKAQMQADEAHRSQQKMLHLGAAALAGFLACRWMK